MTTFNFISDDSHGWLEVNLNEYPEAKKFATGCGYINGSKIYLEEDDEATGFINYLKEKGIEFTFNEKNHDGRWYGRSYARNVSGQ
jgi:hypothetical protein